MLGQIEFFGHLVSITATFVVVVAALLQRAGYVINTNENQNYEPEEFESKQESYRYSLMFSLAITIPLITKILIEINLHLSSFKGMSTTRQMSLNFWLTFVNGFLRYIPLQIIFFPVLVSVALPRMTGYINFGIHMAQLSALSYYFSFALIDRRNREDGPIFTSAPVSFLAMACTVTYALLFLSKIPLKSNAISACYWTMFITTSILILYYLRLSYLRNASMNVVSDAAITQSRAQNNKELTMNQFIGVTSREDELHTMILLASLFFCANIVVIGFSSVNNELVIAASNFLIQKQVDSALVLVATVIAMLWILLGDRKLRHEVVNMQAAKRLNRGFVRFISHELRSPLNHQVLGLQMLYDDLSNDDRMTSKLKEIAELQDTCEASLQILNDILVFDELSNGTTGDNSNNINGSSSRPKILMVDVFLNDTVKRFRNRSHGDGVKFNVDIDLSLGSPINMNRSPSMSSLNNVGTNNRMDNRSHGQSNASHSTGNNKPLLLVDRVELKCVLRSLIRNAERASPVNGTVTIKSYLISHNTPSNGFLSQTSSFSEYIPILSLARPNQSSKGSSKESKPNSPICSSSETSHGPEHGSSKTTMGNVSNWFGSLLNQNSSTNSRESFHPNASVLPTSPLGSQTQSVASISGIAMSSSTTLPKSSNTMFRGLFGSSDEYDRGKQFGLTEAGILRIEISDQGSGMSLDDQKKLLKRSMALAPEDLQCGQAAGLRITIARAILERYGGLLTVESQGINRGCTFIAHIPYYYRKKGMIQQTFGNSTITQAIQHALTIVNGNFTTQPGTLDMKALELDRHSSSASHGSPSWKSSSAHHDESRSNSMRSSNSTSFGNHVLSTKSSMEAPNPNNQGGANNNNNNNNNSNNTINGLRNRIMSRISTGSNQSSRGDGTGSKENSVHSRNSTSSSCPPAMSTNNNSHNSHNNNSSTTQTLSCTVPPSEWSPSTPSANKVVPMNGITRSALESRRLNILIVDDVVSSRKILKRMLVEMGHTVDEAVDGIDAIRMVELAKKDCHPFDAIFMDCMMPRMDGPTATRQILALGYTGIIIGFTGITSYDSNRFLSCGASKMLEKPLKREVVALVMHEISQRVQRRMNELENTQRTVLSDGEENEGDAFNENTPSAFVVRTRSRDEDSNGNEHVHVHHGKHHHIHHNNHNHNHNHNHTQRSNHKEPENVNGNNIEADNSQITKSEQQSNSNNTKSLHFLVVDDVPSNRKMVSRILTRRGFTVDEACDGLDAYLRVAKSIRKQQLESDKFSVNFEVESTNSNGNNYTGNHNANNNKIIPVLDPIQKIMNEFQVQDSALLDDTNEASTIRPFDGIIMDFVMPNLDGPSACKRLREELKYRRPIIGVTGNVLSSDIEIFMAQGANRVIGKPLKMELFDEILKDLYPELLTSRTFT